MHLDDVPEGRNLVRVDERIHETVGTDKALEGIILLKDFGRDEPTTQPTCAMIEKRGEFRRHQTHLMMRGR